MARHGSRRYSLALVLKDDLYYLNLLSRYYRSKENGLDTKEKYEYHMYLIGLLNNYLQIKQVHKRRNYLS